MNFLVFPIPACAYHRLFVRHQFIPTIPLERFSHFSHRLDPCGLRTECLIRPSAACAVCKVAVAEAAAGPEVWRRLRQAANASCMRDETDNEALPRDLCIPSFREATHDRRNSSRMPRQLSRSMIVDCNATSFSSSCDRSCEASSCKRNVSASSLATFSVWERSS